MPPTHRLPPEGATSMPLWPHRGCDDRGGLARGTLRAKGHPGGGPWRQVSCPSCRGYFLEPPGPVFHGPQAAVERLVRRLAGLAQGGGIRAPARVFEGEANPVLQGLGEAAEPRRALSRYCLGEVHVEPWQREAVEAGLRAVKTGARSADEALQRLERAPVWVWTAREPQSPGRVVIAGGTHPVALAQRRVPQVGQRLAPPWVPRG